MAKKKKKLGRPKGSKNKKLKIPKLLKRTAEPTECQPTFLRQNTTARFVIERFEDEVASILYRELRVPTYYLLDTRDGDNGRYVGRIFDERFASLIVEFLNGRKRVPKRLRERLNEVTSDEI